MPSAYPLPLAFSRRHALLALLLFVIELLIGTLLELGQQDLHGGSRYARAGSAP